MAKKGTKTSKKRTTSKGGVTKKASSVKKKAARKTVAKKVVKKAAKKTTVKKKAAKKVTPKKVAVKKASVRKVAVKKKAVTLKVAKPKKPYLTEADLLKFRNLLLQKRREILGCFNEMENEALKQSRLDAAGDLSSMPIHMADLGSDNFEQEFALGLMDNERGLLRDIDMALMRIVEGTYGYCEGTGKPIPKARLNAKPWARYCVEYARLIEEGKVPEFEQ